MARVTIFAGHYGSGKTQIAVNWALRLRAAGDSVILCDLDIVNPYFRTADCIEPLREAGVRLIASPLANTNVENASLPADVSAVFDNLDHKAVLDVGGDDRGMLALGRYANRLRGDDYDLWMVANPYRPLAATPELAMELLREMESAAGLSFTGLVANPNIGRDTTVQTVAAARPYMRQLSALSGLPVVMTCIRRDLADDGMQPNLFPIDIFANRFQI